MDRIRSPYNFVPVSPKVVLPDWADVPAQDVPFEDGISGTFELELEALTPLFVRGASPRDGLSGNFFELPGGKHAIPGSELRGMLRNVVEIASFGKLSRVNDHRYGVRDLQNRSLYTDHMADIVQTPDGKKQPIPLVEAGWLRRADGDDRIRARIEPCHFAKIHYRALTDLAAARGKRNFHAEQKQSAANKYETWGAPHGEEAPRQVQVRLTTLRPPSHKGRTFRSEYGVAVPDPLGNTSGHLVFTGQPQRWNDRDPKNRAKRHDFVFYGSAGAPLDVNEQALKDFEFIHSDRGQQARMADSKPNEEWGFWEEAFARGERVPVFFLCWPPGDKRAGQLRAFGLAMMFRLAYAHSVREVVTRFQAEARSPRQDLAEVVFGVVPPSKDDEAGARRGRVSFGLLRAASGRAELEEPVRDLVLGAPKPSYYPSYVEQGDGYGDAPASKDDYRTFMDADARVRGWKRYRPHDRVRVAHRPRTRDGTNLDLSRVATPPFRPAKAGTAFRGPVRIHNLRPVELGAILWAIDFGGRSDCFHLLGLARPLGYGRTRLRIAGHRLVANDERDVDLSKCRDAFVQYMEQELKELPNGWEKSVQIHDLIALARAVPADSDEAGHMQLDHPTDGNEFVAAKKLGLALAPVDRPQQRAARSPGAARAASGATTAGTRPTSAGGRPPWVGGARGQSRGPGPRPAAPLPMSKPGPRWSGLATGSRVKARLTTLSRKGKWQVELLEHDASGVVQGDPPAGLKEGDVVEVVVQAGASPVALVLRWS